MKKQLDAQIKKIGDEAEKPERRIEGEFCIGRRSMGFLYDEYFGDAKELADGLRMIIR